MPLDSLLAEARDLLPETVAFRRDLHRHPELGNDLPRTQAKVLEAIEPLGLDIRTGRDLTSVVATLDTGRPGGTMLLRGDMDALPMPEDTDVEFRSTVDGAMHACGHDAHTAMLVTAAQLLADKRDLLSGKVVFMFQPGEEGFHGARFMLDEGLLDGIDVTRAFAIHQSPSMPSGMIATKGGPLMASADVFEVEVVGRGGHASMPHHALDPIPIACQMVGAFQTMVTRRVEVFDPAVVTVAKIRAGTTNNVIPEKALLTGTIRTVSEKSRQLVHEELERIATNMAIAHGAAATFKLERGYPVTINDADSAAWVREVAAKVIDPELVSEMPTPVMGAEDWSYVLQQVPGAMAFLGTCPPGVNFWEAAPNHSNRMVIDEDAMATGTAMYAGAALAELAVTD